VTARRARQRPDPAKRPNRRQPVPRDQSKKETREALIRAAIDLFGTEGLETPSLDAICERAGYTRGAFYVHFRDRDELVVAVMERVTGVLLDTLIATGDAALDLERTVRTFADAVAAGAYPVPGSVRSHQILQACARSETIRERYVATLNEAVRRVTRVIERGQAAGSVRQDVDPSQVANLLIALVLSVQTLREVDYPIDVRLACDALLTMVRA
jgi:TetR/AcrR family transcriptional regulator, transcriptional repressor for nem operon